MALTNVVDFYSTPASAKTGMRSRYVTQSNGVVVRKSSIRKLPNENLKRNLSFEASKARKLIYNLLRDMPTEKVYQDSNRNTLTFYYKL